MPNGRDGHRRCRPPSRSVVLIPVPEPGHVDPDPAIPLRGQSLPVGAAGRQRRRRRDPEAGGAARVPRGNRPGARTRRPARRAVPHARLLRRRDDLLRLSGLRRRRPKRPRWTRTRTSSQDVRASRSARHDPPRRDHRHEDGRGADADLNTSADRVRITELHSPDRSDRGASALSAEADATDPHRLSRTACVASAVPCAVCAADGMQRDRETSSMCAT